MTETPKPPAHLSKSSAAYFKKFVDEYEVEDSHIEVLIRVCESMDRADQAALDLKKHGSLITKDRFGCERAHPLVQVDRTTQGLFFSASRTARASWICFRVRPTDAAEKAFSSGTLFGLPRIAASSGCTLSYSSASLRCAPASISLASA
jgi:hypothetical protein